MAKTSPKKIPHNVIRVPRNLKDQEKKKKKNINRGTKGGRKEVYVFQIHSKTLLVSLKDTEVNK